MSEGEIFVGFLSFALAVAASISWYRPIFQVTELASPAWVRILLALLPFFSLAIVFVVILKGASWDVRESLEYTIYYLVMGLAWVGALTMWAVPFCGISVRDDVLERSNISALWSVVGSVIALSVCFSGGNVGDGPGVHAVLLSSGLATVALFAFWWLLHVLTDGTLTDAVTINRDAGAGVRLSGYLLGMAFILGFSVAGDWVEGRLLPDFVALAWPVLPMMAAAVSLERTWRANHAFALSAVNAIVFVGLGVGYCVYQLVAL